jgi:hypothetical protein
MLLTGKEFNEKYKNDRFAKFVKLTNESENHNGFQFKTGLNIDKNVFNPTKECKAGGLYFCNFINIPSWIIYDGYLRPYLRYVTIPDDAQVYIKIIEFKVEGVSYFESFFKADKFILSDRISVSKFNIQGDENYCLGIIKRNSHMLNYIKNKTEKICIEAIRRNPTTLRYVDDCDQTERMCLEAVNLYGGALEYVRNQTDEMCLASVKQSWVPLMYVKNQTAEICLKAVRHDRFALKYVENKFKDAVIRQLGLNVAA